MKNLVPKLSTCKLLKEAGWEKETELVCDWKLTKDGKELTDDDQTDETIEAIYKLIKK